MIAIFLVSTTPYTKIVYVVITLIRLVEVVNTNYYEIYKNSELITPSKRVAKILIKKSPSDFFRGREILLSSDLRFAFVFNPVQLLVLSHKTKEVLFSMFPA
jgi:hypothetical protein